MTGRIRDSLTRHFGEDRIFTDVDSVPLGVDFKQFIDENVAKCEILIIVIGTQWLGSKDSKSMHRIDDPTDFVRLELNRH